MNTGTELFYRKILRNMLLPAGDIFFRQEMIRRLRFLEKAQWWNRDDVKRYQDLQLVQLVKTAYAEVPFYREWMNAAGISPADIQSAKDLHRMPIVSKQALRKKYPLETTRKTGRKTYEVSTSGSTGSNFRLYEDAQTAGWYRASFILALEWAGWSFGELHLQTGMTLERDLQRKLKDFFLRCHYFPAYDLSDDHLDKCLDLLEKKKMRHLWGYPGSLYFIARRAIRVKRNIQLYSIVTWGDNLYPQYRTALQEAFNARVTDTYGCAEGIQIAAQCDSGTYHVHDLDVILDYVDDNGHPVSSNQVGHLILTRLHPGPMPLIRYKVGDMGIRGDKMDCSCGRGFHCMESIQGRETDAVITPSGNRLIVHFFTGILEHFPEIDSFQIVQKTPQEVVLYLKPFRTIDKGLQNTIVTTLIQNGASGLNFSVQIVSEIPPLAGKRRFIINETINSVWN